MRPRKDGLACETADKVVVVHGDAEQRQLLTSLLQKAGLEAVCFNKAETALRAMEKGGTPCLLVTDIYLPEIDGWRFCRLLRSPDYASLNRVPILIVSTIFTGDAAGQIAADLGAEAFLPCPLDEDEFIGMVKALIEGQGVCHKVRVLVVEDDPSMARIMEQVFQTAGYHVTLADSLASARAVFHRSYYDIAVVDEFLPDGLGSALMQGERSRYPGCAFIMISGSAAPGKILDWMKAGASASISKPFDMAYLLECCERARRERALLRSEELLAINARFLQAQKMQTVGRLAGGIAHDFNNMLSVILGNIELSMQMVADQPELVAFLQEAYDAGLRSAETTRQLLAFSRQQTIAPVELDLNLRIPETMKMLERLLGENIELDWKPADPLWRTCLDPTQIDQVLANLCVNARDAIGGNGGRIVISTENCELDSAFCEANNGSQPGAYACIRVRDNGCGMHPEVLQNVFEPFFTTKAIGKGTGLGLSTVYGIVKQNRGYIAIDSEMNAGTTVAIYLPRAESQSTLPPLAEPQVPQVSALATGQDNLPGAFRDPDDVPAAIRTTQEAPALSLTCAYPIDAIGRLGSSLVQEVHNLLVVVRWYADQALRHSREGISCEDWMERIVDVARSSVEAAPRMLADYMRRFCASQEVWPENIDLRQILERRSSALRELLGPGVELHLNISSDPMYLCIDPAQIDQILVCLLLNARHAIADVAAGKVEILTKSVMLDAQFLVDGDAAVPGQYACMVIHDNGCGIHADILPKIFEPFFTTNKDNGSLGLGLTLVEGVVRQNRGCIRVDTDGSTGTCFRVYLPQGEPGCC